FTRIQHRTTTRSLHHIKGRPKLLTPRQSQDWTLIRFPAGWDEHLARTHTKARIADQRCGYVVVAVLPAVHVEEVQRSRLVTVEPEAWLACVVVRTALR